MLQFLQLFSFCFFALFFFLYFSIVCFNKRFIDIENDIDLPKNVHTKKMKFTWKRTSKNGFRLFVFWLPDCMNNRNTQKDEEKRKITFAFYEKLQLDVKRVLVSWLKRIFLFCMHFGRLCLSFGLLILDVLVLTDSWDHNWDI